MVEIKYVPSICPYCGTGCGINFVVKDGNEGIQFQVVKVYTLADGQPAVKLMRI